MDIKGIAWVGNIYQKFENMCLEVGEALYQDMLSTSSKDLRILASADLSLNPYLEYGIPKPKSSLVKEEAIGHVCVKGISDKKSSSSNDVWEDWSTTSFNCEISDNDSGNCDRNDLQTSNEGAICKLKGQQERDICNVTEDTSFVSSPPETIVLNKFSAMVGKKSSCISSSNIIRTERIEDTCESSGLVSQMGSQVTSNTSSSQSVEEDLPHLDLSVYSGTSLSRTHSDTSANTQRGQPADDVVLPSHTGTSIDSASNLKEEKENDTSATMIQPVGHESEETCVLVDGNDYCPHNHKEEIRRSYKKKIQSVFSLKKKPSRKQEYKQLAAQSVKFDAELNIHGDEAIRPAPSLSENIKSKKFAVNESIESEWELL